MVLVVRLWLVVVLASQVWVLASSAAAQVSPGPLARAHAKFEGATKCTQCHAGGGKAMGGRCQACHREVAWLAERSLGLHGSAPVKAAACESCHPDHAGVDFELIKWPDGDRARFDHRRAGWRLEGSHAKLECDRCHDARYRASPAAALAPGRSNWIGLTGSCASCHEDAHGGALGERCQSCHDTGTWTTTPGFRHDTTDYPLTGLHRRVGCDDCHGPNRLGAGRDRNGSAARYGDLPHATCAACHRDVHAGSFGGNCSGCHTTDGFKTIVASGGFDHGRTRFPLEGRHAAVKCVGCHRDFTTEAGRRPASATCAGCHRPDPHGGSATLGGVPVDCAACHNASGFTPSTFPIERHQVSRYPLEGRHLTVRCAACHRKNLADGAAIRLGAARVMIRPAAKQCLECHRDEHGGQFAARSDRGDCAGCHQPAGWTPSGFGVEAHGRLRLTLEGRHGEVACRACHEPSRSGAKPAAGAALGKAGLMLAGLDPSCNGCHQDAHAGRFGPTGARPAPNGCQTCHDTKAFRPSTVQVAVHQSFRFPLGGAHRAVPCERCHQEIREGNGRSASLALRGRPGVRAVPISTFEAKASCAACHETVHGNQFDRRKGGSGCENCHGDDGFVPASRLDHDRDTNFPLDAGHRTVACQACHRPQPNGALPRVIYRAVARDCERCHGAR